jgi:hypothetical protein
MAEMTDKTINYLLNEGSTTGPKKRDSKSLGVNIINKKP